MPRYDIDALPDHARLWIFGTDGPLPPDERSALLDAVDDHLEGWAAHGHPIVAARDWIENNFLIVAADERASGVSGCSIDALFLRLQALEDRLGISLTDRGRIWFRGADGAICSVDRPTFARLARDGEVDPQTAVFDPTIDALGELRAGRFEKPLCDSWHAKAFPMTGAHSA